LGLDNFLINELGIALIAPNIRGSSGFGKSFAALDDGGKREDALGDLNALLDWIAQQADFDNQRIAVAGTGYGGYLALAVATSYPKRIAATISIAGMANLASLLQRTPNDLRERYRAEYGDERDAKTRALLDRLAPLRTAHQIFRPILVAQGNNDTRASRTESEQLVTEVRRNLFPAWYLLADDEAQGFAKKSNAEFLFYAELRFLERYVLAK
jgi:dipeptidyl aminopeptidase/acylaminoacyl peptidase